MIKRLFGILILICTAGFALSCDKDSPAEGPIKPLQMELGVVTFVGASNYFEITDDSGNIYIVEQDVVSQYGIVEGKRLRVFYFDYVDMTRDDSIRQELRGKARVWKINPDKLQFVLSKPAIRESFILENEKKRRDSIGYDPIRPYGDQKVWLGGDYLNIHFEYLRYETEVRHLINLVWDDTRPTRTEVTEDEDEYVYLYLHHNAYGEVPGNVAIPKHDTGICSFNLTQMVPKNKKSVRIKLFWKWYPNLEEDSATEEYSSDLGEFTPSGYINRGVDTKPGDNPYYISPPENPTAFVK